MLDDLGYDEEELLSAEKEKKELMGVLKQVTPKMSLEAENKFKNDFPVIVVNHISQVGSRALRYHWKNTVYLQKIDKYVNEVFRPCYFSVFPNKRKPSYITDIIKIFGKYKEDWVKNSRKTRTGDDGRELSIFPISSMADKYWGLAYAMSLIMLLMKMEKIQSAHKICPKCLLPVAPAA